jgi:hypothetical protein
VGHELGESGSEDIGADAPKSGNMPRLQRPAACAGQQPASASAVKAVSVKTTADVLADLLNPLFISGPSQNKNPVFALQGGKNRRIGSMTADFFRPFGC